MKKVFVVSKTHLDLGFSLEVVASEKNEFVTRVMRSSSGSIGTVYYAKAASNGTCQWIILNNSIRENTSTTIHSNIPQCVVLELLFEL